VLSLHFFLRSAEESPDNTERRTISSLMGLFFFRNSKCRRELDNRSKYGQRENALNRQLMQMTVLLGKPCGLKGQIGVTAFSYYVARINVTRVGCLDK